MCMRLSRWTAMQPKLMKGNHALAEAAIRAGMTFFSGYPITPQSEIPEYLSDHLPAAGGSFIQAESELAGVNMLYGAAAAGHRVMTSSSGPGFSLLQEGMSYIASAELPAVFVDVQRYGNGVGGYFSGPVGLFHGHPLRRAWGLPHPGLCSGFGSGIRGSGCRGL